MEAAWHAMRGTNGEIALALERKKAVSKPTVLLWVKQLRAAADELEKLL